MKQALQIVNEGTRFWIFTCEPYSFLIGVMNGDYFVLDTHPVLEEEQGRSGRLQVFRGTSALSLHTLCRNVWARLHTAGVRNQPQSISLIVFPTMGERYLFLMLVIFNVIKDE